MATGNIGVTEGAGKNIASNTITEDSITKQLQRVVINNSAGTELTQIPVIIGGSVLTVGTAAPNQSVSGTIGASIIGLTPVAVVNIPSISGQVGASIIGTVPVVQSGTVISSISGNLFVQAASISGAYAEDSASSNADIGLFVLGVRNDTLSSLVSADGDYTGIATGPSGELITANAPLTKWVQGQGSIFSGVIQPIIPAQGASIFSYITAIQVVNASANNAYLTLFGAASSIIGYTVAPANGGSNIVMPNGLKTSPNAAFSASVSGVASVFLTAQGFISKS